MKMEGLFDCTVFEDLPNLFPYIMDQQSFQGPDASAKDSFPSSPQYLTSGNLAIDTSNNRWIIDRFISSMDDPYVPGYSQLAFGQPQSILQDNFSSFHIHDHFDNRYPTAYHQRLSSPHDTSSSRSSFNDFSPVTSRGSHRSDFGHNSIQSPLSPSYTTYDDSYLASFAYQQTHNVQYCLQDIQINPDEFLEHSAYHPYDMQPCDTVTINQHVPSYGPSNYEVQSLAETTLSAIQDDKNTEDRGVDEDSTATKTKSEENDSDYKPVTRNTNRKRSRTDLEKGDIHLRASARPRKGSFLWNAQGSPLEAGQHGGARSRSVKPSYDNRQFPCLLKSYGCPSTFASKNEWKRHMSTQHLCFRVWRCDLCPNSASRPNEFNRKDLFSSHLKRMHPAEHHAASNYVDSIYERCSVQVRCPPPEMSCTLCNMTFQCQESCDEWLEHIGRHFLKLAKEVQPTVKSELGNDEGGENLWETDNLFQNWLISEQMLVINPGSNKLTLADKDKTRTRDSVSKKDSGDEDAEGDEE